MALRVVPDVDQRLLRAAGHRDLVEEGARAAAQLGDADRLAARAIRVAHGVRAALGDPGQEGLRRERPRNGRLWIEAVAGDAAHIDIGRRRSDDATKNVDVRTEPSVRGGLGFSVG